VVIEPEIHDDKKLDGGKGTSIYEKSALISTTTSRGKHTPAAPL
jgi:hypothetical protein